MDAFSITETVYYISHTFKAVYSLHIRTLQYLIQYMKLIIDIILKNKFVKTATNPYICTAKGPKAFNKIKPVL